MTVVKVRDTESTSGDVRPHESREVGAHHEIGPVLADPVRREPPELHETIDQMDLLQLVADTQIPLLPRGPQELRRPLVGILPREIDSLGTSRPLSDVHPRKRVQDPGRTTFFQSGETWT